MTIETDTATQSAEPHPACPETDNGDAMENRFPILVAEDNPVTRKLLAKTLRKAGHTATFVTNGREAFELFRKKFFPIILTDWVMPEMDGLELCRAIRAAGSPGYVFIILLTARNSKEDIVAGLESGADDYLSKPFNPGELKARIKTGVRILNLERSLKKANEEIKKLTVTDPLTGCYNRGFVNERLARDLKRAERYGRRFSLVLCDIDHFKSVNDTYGHRAGDQVLKMFVDRIQKSIRQKVDWLARYGGEEFLLGLPETGLEGARNLAERLRSEISGKKMRIDDAEITITASFGIADFVPRDPKKPVSPDSLLAMADKLLYQAKREGRNRIRTATL